MHFNIIIIAKQYI